MRTTLCHRVLAGALFLLLAAGARASAAAQDRASRPGPRPGWTPRRISITGDITPAQKAAAIAKLEAIERVFLAVPELANPEGFQVWPLFSGGSRRLGFGDVPDRRNVLEYRFNLGLCVPTIKEGGCGSISATVNFSDAPGGARWHDEHGRAIYVEEMRGDAYGPAVEEFRREVVPLATETYDRLFPTVRSWVTVILTAGGDLPWKPVTREEYYNSVIFDAEGKNGEKLREFRQANETSAYQQSAVHKALWQTFQKLDWAALNRLLDPGP